VVVSESSAGWAVGEKYLANDPDLMSSVVGHSQTSRLECQIPLWRSASASSPKKMPQCWQLTLSCSPVPCFLKKEKKSVSGDYALSVGKIPAFGPDRTVFAGGSTVFPHPSLGGGTRQRKLRWFYLVGRVA
jgi:hypothetical protein